MLEQRLQELFEQQAADLPLARASVATAASQGRAYRSRLRRRRLVAIGTPFLAAAAVLAIALAGVLAAPAPVPPAQHGGPGHAAPPPARILRLAAVPGWLPQGYRFQWTDATPVGSSISGMESIQYEWGVTLYHRAECSLRASKLTCPMEATAQPGSYTYQLTGQAPGLRGLPAYWADNVNFEAIEAFEYAPGSWGIASFTSRADEAGVVRHLRFGRAVPLLRYPVQLTDTWPGLGLTDTGGGAYWQYGALDAQGFNLGGKQFPATGVRPAIVVQATAFQRGVCTSASIGRIVNGDLTPVPGTGTREVINGYRVAIWQLAAGRSHNVRWPAQQELCTPTAADGMDVTVIVTGTFRDLSAASIFAHLKMFGPNPKDWTTIPIH